MKWIDLIFPKRCVGCGGVGSYLCANCVGRFRLATPICPMCSRGSMFGVVHAKCRRKLGMDGVVRVFEYSSVVKRLIMKLKYKRVTDLLETLIELLVTMGEFQPLEKGGWIVVPIPLYRKKYLSRGFNQAELLAKGIADYFGWQCDVKMLGKKRETKSQASLKRGERLVNVRGAFGVSSEASDGSNNRRILLVDDVWTTGATMRECSKVLKRVGVKEVWGLAVAS